MSYHDSVLDDHLGTGGLEEDHAETESCADSDAVLEAPEHAGQKRPQERDEVQL